MAGGNDSHLEREVLGQPETNIGRLAELGIDEVVDFVNNEDDFGFFGDFLLDYFFPGLKNQIPQI